MNQQQSVQNQEFISLAEKMRPVCFHDYIGQEKVVGSNAILQQLLTKGHIPSMIFWGPPGCGKVIIIFYHILNIIININFMKYFYRHL